MTETSIDKKIIQSLDAFIPHFARLTHDNPMRKLLVAYYKYRSCFDFSKEIYLKNTTMQQKISESNKYEKHYSKLHPKATPCKWGDKCHSHETYHKHRYIHYMPPVYAYINSLSHEIAELERCQAIFLQRRNLKEDLDIKKREFAQDFTIQIINIYLNYSADEFTQMIVKLQDFERPVHPRGDNLEYFLYNPIFAILMSFILHITDYIKENNADKPFSAMFGYMDQTGISGTYKLDKINRFFPDVYKIYETQILKYLSPELRDPIIGVNTLSAFFQIRENEDEVKEIEGYLHQSKRAKSGPLAGRPMKTKNKNKKSERKLQKRKQKKAQNTKKRPKGSRNLRSQREKRNIKRK